MCKPSKDNTPPGAASPERLRPRDRIESLVRSGLHDEAVAVLEAQLRRSPRDAEALRLCARIEQQRDGQGMGILLAEKAEAIESHPDSLTLVARGRMSAGRTDEALACFRTLLGMLPGHVGTRLMMARARVGGAHRRGTGGARAAARRARGPRFGNRARGAASPRGGARP
jgi:hypothetical protein